MLLTYDAALPDFDEGGLDVLDVGQRLVQVRQGDRAPLRVAFGDGGDDPAREPHI